ncbi:hypothetical protein PCK1_002166 [Pneumocystis canis]|nr:hypothetical protein PCK1_002166 [Pneumocystis canis]
MTNYIKGTHFDFMKEPLFLKKYFFACIFLTWIQNIGKKLNDFTSINFDKAIWNFDLIDLNSIMYKYGQQKCNL